jgi:lipopolysaccharide transport system ATP-binding protein
MYARLGFSVAAHVNPEILLIDEVLSVGDFPFQAKCLQRMKETISKGTAVVYISHNIPSVIELCSQTVLLSGGKIQKFGPSADVSRFYYRTYADAHRADASIRLRNVELLSTEAKPSHSFAAASWATLRLTVCSAVPIEAAMSFFIKRSDGLIIFDASSDTAAAKMYSLKGNQTRTITVHFRINLPRGTYFLGVNLWNPEKGVFYLYQDEVLEFHVQAPLVGGYAFLDMRWQ